MPHKISKNKNVPLNWYFSTKFFLERIGWFLTLKIDFENQILALFDSYFWPFNKTHEKIVAIYVISPIMASIWNVFTKFCWLDEKLTEGGMLLLLVATPPGSKLLSRTLAYILHNALLFNILMALEHLQGRIHACLKVN